MAWSDSGADFSVTLKSATVLSGDSVAGETSPTPSTLVSAVRYVSSWSLLSGLDDCSSTSDGWVTPAGRLLSSSLLYTVDSEVSAVEPEVRSNVGLNPIANAL